MTGPVASAEVELAALTLFAEVLDLEPQARERFLIEQTAGNSTLLARVRELLAADASNLSRFMPTSAGAATGADAAASIGPPERVGPYRLEELIGAGGMGSVYRARRDDGLFDQTVAVKFIRPLRGTLDVVPLVDAERRLLARMEHPAIARILDGGTTDSGLHYLVMEFVRGVALDEHVAQASLDARARVELLREVCAAVSHAHQNLVLHCDLKPANVLVTEDGRPKLIDFGVARIQDVVDAALPDGFTRAYTSPQRLAGAPATVADDVFSLGIVLHELVTGVLPADDGLLAPTLPVELAAVVRKATALERDARYGSVGELTADLAAWIERRPVRAMGRHWRYRARKLVERHPWRVAAASLAVTGLIGALVVTTALYRRAEVARADAEQRFSEVRALANYMLFDLDAKLEVTPGNTGARREMVGRSQQYLDALARTAGQNIDLQREAAVGFARLAEVQGVPGRAGVGAQSEAKRSLERARDMLLQLVMQRPGDGGLERDLARTRYLLGLTYGATENSPTLQNEEATAAESGLLSALARAERGEWRATAADLADLHISLLGTRLLQANSLMQREDYAGAARIDQSEEQRMLALPADVRAAMDHDYQTGRPAMLLGDALYYVERFEESLAAYRRAQERFERSLARDPLNRRLLEGVLIGGWSISGTLSSLKRNREALAVIERVLPIADRLVSLDPKNFEQQRLREMARDQRAQVLMELDRFRDAIEVFEASIVRRRERAAGDPDSAELARSVGVPYRSLVKSHRGLRDDAGACRVLAEGVAVWQAVDARWPLNEFDRRTELDVLRADLARCRQR